jgi:hypothetical protein
MSLEMYLWPAQRAGWEILLSGTSPISSVLSRLLSVSMNISSPKLHSGSTECFSVNCRITGGKRQGYVTYPAGEMHMYIPLGVRRDPGRGALSESLKSVRFPAPASF